MLNEQSQKKVSKIINLIEEADAFTVEDSPILTSVAWSDTPNGDPNQKVLGIEWIDEDGERRKISFLAGSLANSILSPHGSIQTLNRKCDSVAFRLYNLVYRKLTTEDIYES